MRCSFCNKSQSQVELVRGPGTICICVECISLISARLTGRPQSISESSTDSLDLIEHKGALLERLAAEVGPLFELEASWEQSRSGDETAKRGILAACSVFAVSALMLERGNLQDSPRQRHLLAELGVRLLTMIDEDEGPPSAQRILRLVEVLIASEEF
jgi:hypothetical protein